MTFSIEDFPVHRFWDWYEIGLGTFIPVWLFAVPPASAKPVLSVLSRDTRPFPTTRPAHAQGYGFSRANPVVRGNTRDLRVLWALEEMQLPFEIVGMDHPAHDLSTTEACPRLCEQTLAAVRRSALHRIARAMTAPPRRRARWCSVADARRARGQSRSALPQIARAMTAPPRRRA